MPAKQSISIVLPVYNAAKYLREALASVRWQTMASWECICIDDGSTDESSEILRQFAAADSRIRVVRQGNQGIVGALNRGLREARHEWVAIMHADDIAAPKRLEVQQRFIQLNPDCIVVGSDMQTVDPDGKPVEWQRAACDHAEIERLLLAGKNTMNHPTVMMRRDAVLAAGMYRPQHEWVEDADLWLRLARVGRLANIPRVLLKYRLHEGSLTWTRRETVNERMRALLAEAYSDRGLAIPRLDRLVPPLKPLRPSSSKWARRAARSGYFSTARKHLGRIWQTEGHSANWMHVFAVVYGRRIMSVGRARRPPEFQVPEWKPWDCIEAAAIESHRKAA